MKTRILDLVRDHFSAPSAVEEYQGRVARGLLAWEQHVAARYLTPPGTLLDIGCGAGREAIALHGLGHYVTGIDVSPQQVEAARESARRLGKCIEFRVCDGTDLPFADCSFQHIVMWAQAFGNIPARPNRLHLLQECARVLAPSGIASLSAHNRDTCEPVARSKDLICDPGDVILEDGDFIVRDEPRSDARCFYHYFRRDELVGLCQTSGLRIRTCALAADLGQTGWDTIWVVVAEKSAAGSPEGAGCGKRAHDDPPLRESYAENAENAVIRGCPWMAPGAGIACAGGAQEVRNKPGARSGRKEAGGASST